jgi:DNA-binding NtrC family response regulator
LQFAINGYTVSCVVETSGSPYRVLVVDDEVPCAEVVAALLSRSERCDVEIQTTALAGLARAQEESFDVIVLDMVMPQMDGIEFIRNLPLEDRPEVIILSGNMTVRSVVEAMKLGASDCVPKGADLDALEVLVLKAGEARRRKRDLQLLSRRIEHQSARPAFITHSAKMRAILEVLGKVAASNVSVLLTGESGTGKDLLARLLHERSARPNGPFVEVNCAALSESLLEAELFGYEKGAFTGAAGTRPGLVETADGGTLFLDEVAEMPTPLQAKLLRMTEDRSLYRVGGRQKIRVDLRIVAATNRDLAREIEGGRFRQDLYFRLAGVEISVPPLRERPEDVEPLALNYLRAASRQVGRGPTDIAPDAFERLRRYRWPGNVRELRNLTERLALLVEDPVVQVAHLPAEIASIVASRPLVPVAAPAEAGDLGLRDLERQRIQRVLEEEGWHRERAATRLGLPVRTLYRKIRAYSLLPPDGDPGH